MVHALETLRTRVDEVRLPLTLPGVQGSRADRGQLLDQLDDYLIPRLRQLDAPLLAVVGGSTGAGKSTLVNSVLRREVTRAGVLRPTTRSPVLVHHPEDARWFTTNRILPSLARITGDDPEPSPEATQHRIGAVRLMACDALPEGFALLDAPDIDSVVDANRELAAQLLAAGDLWLFVTTAARYADAVPWDLLRTAAERGTSVAVVLDRVPPEAMDEVRTDLAGMLAANSLSDAPLFTIPEVALQDGLLPSGVMAKLRLWFMDLASSSAARQEVVRRTLGGALDSLGVRVPALAGAADEQAAADQSLREEVAQCYGVAATRLEAGLTDGTLLRGEVLARWQEFVGTGEVLRGLESAVGRVRDRLVSAITGKPAPAEPLGQALQTGVAALVHAEAAQASEQAVLRWRTHPAGAALIGPNPTEMSRLSPDFDQRMERMVRDWQGHVLDLVRQQAGSKRSQARYMSLGVNAIGITLMILVFASTAAIPTGAEVGVGAGTAVVGQRLLEAIFGDQAVRQLAAEARRDLMARVEGLLQGEQDRLIDLLVEAGVDPDAGPGLRAAGEKVQATR
ncbi:MAG: dynamin family protein [Actinomycetales bacterium]